MNRVNIKTTWGTILLTLDDQNHPIDVTLPMLEKDPDVPFRITSPRKWKNLTDVMRNAASFNIPEGTEFQQAVWKALTKIPSGQTRTYGEIAKAIGRPKAVRAVGTACGANPLPLFVPCHRVVAANGGLGGFGSGLPWKKLLLKQEKAL